VLTSEMTLKCWVGRKHCTVKAKWVVTTVCVTDIAITVMYYSTNQKKGAPSLNSASYSSSKQSAY
jgi:hypothetical protein